MNLLVEFFFPKKCGICGRLGQWLCGECAGKMRGFQQKCPMCEKRSVGGRTHPRCKTASGLDGLVALFDYKQAEVVRLIKAVKYRFNRELMEEWLSGLDLRLNGLEIDLVVPVPLHRRRYNWRGFNQAQIVVEVVAGQNELATAGILRRKIYTQPLAETEDQKERKRLVKGVFEAEKAEIEGKNILLVDDVFTSGATMKECCRVLKKAGAEKVYAMVVAG